MVNHKNFLSIVGLTALLIASFGLEHAEAASAGGPGADEPLGSSGVAQRDGENGDGLSIAANAALVKADDAQPQEAPASRAAEILRAHEENLEKLKAASAERQRAWEEDMRRLETDHAVKLAAELEKLRAWEEEQRRLAAANAAELAAELEKQRAWEEEQQRQAAADAAELATAREKTRVAQQAAADARDRALAIERQLAQVKADNILSLMGIALAQSTGRPPAVPPRKPDAGGAAGGAAAAP